MATILTEIFNHHLWANLGMIDACANLTDAQLEAAATGTYGAIGPTLLHLASAESRFVAAVTSDHTGLTVNEREPFPGFPAIRASLQKSGERLVALAQSEHNDRTVAGERGGQAFSIALSVFMMQSVDHGKEHRTHVATSMTQFGIEPPNLDGWAYTQRRGSASG